MTLKYDLKNDTKSWRFDESQTDDLTRLFCDLTECSDDDESCSPLNSQVESWLTRFEIAKDSSNGLQDNASELGAHVAMLLEQDNSELNERQCILLRLVRLHHLETQFDEMLQHEKLASLKQLAYGASHEVNNPLGNVATRAQTLLRSETDPERRRQLAMIVSQTFRAHDMIGDMMLYAHPPTPTFATVDLPSVIRTAISEIELSAASQNTVIEFSIGTIDQQVTADANQVVSMLKAILKNSLDEIKQNGSVRVDLFVQSSRRGKMFGILIEDDGPGLSELALRHLFDPFFSGRESGRGLGFGLCKAKTIAELHGGSIRCENHIDAGKVVGTRVEILLPCEQ